MTEPPMGYAYFNLQQYYHLPADFHKCLQRHDLPSLDATWDQHLFDKAAEDKVNDWHVLHSC